VLVQGRVVEEHQYVLGSVASPLDRIWDDIKAYARSVNMSGDPLAGNSGYDLAGDPRYSAVAGMRDLTNELWSNAEQASAEAGDEMDD